MCRWGWGCFFVGGWGTVLVGLQDCGSICSEFTLLTDVSLMVRVLGGEGGWWWFMSQMFLLLSAQFLPS